MYLVLSAFTSSPISLVATTKVSAFFFTVCFHSVQNLLSSRLPSQNLKIEIYKNIISLVICYGYENLSSH
jgi:hypothetical protein